VTTASGAGTLSDGFDYFEPPYDVGAACSDQYLTWSGFPTLGEDYTVTTQDLGANTQVLLVEISDRATVITLPNRSGVGGAPTTKAQVDYACAALVDRGTTIILGNNPSHTFSIPSDLALLGMKLRTQAVIQLPGMQTTRTQAIYAPLGE
jgi:hypothetical protein